MKRIYCVVLSVILLFNLSCFAVASEPTFSVDEVAVNLLNDALTHPSDFALPDLSEATIYICNPIHPYILTETGLQSCNDIVYHLIRTEQEFVGCITLCYVDSILASASLNLDIAARLNEVCGTDEAFQLVVDEGHLYIKTENAPMLIRDNCTDEISVAIANAEGNLTIATIQNQLTGIITNPITPRASCQLNVPFVSQEGYDICWAAAAAAFGRFHTGSTYANYSASALAAMVGVGNKGATIIESQKILTNIFHINTVLINDRLTDDEAKDLFDQSEPILAVFAGEEFVSKEEVNHMVVLCGYKTKLLSSEFTYYIRDSNYSSIVSVVAYSSDILVMDYYSGSVMFWSESAYRN